MLNSFKKYKKSCKPQPSNIIGSPSDMAVNFINACGDRNPLRKPGSLEKIKDLIEKGADIETRLNYYGYTALFDAIRVMDFDLFSLLVDKGANLKGVINELDSFRNQTGIYCSWWNKPQSEFFCNQCIEYLEEKGLTDSISVNFLPKTW